MNEDRLKEYITEIMHRLRNLAEDRTLPMDVKVHKLLWNEIQTIGHDLKSL